MLDVFLNASICLGNKVLSLHIKLYFLRDKRQARYNNDVHKYVCSTNQAIFHKALRDDQIPNTIAEPRNQSIHFLARVKRLRINHRN